MVMLQHRETEPIQLSAEPPLVSGGRGRKPLSLFSTKGLGSRKPTCHTSGNLYIRWQRDECQCQRLSLRLSPRLPPPSIRTSSRGRPPFKESSKHRYAKKPNGTELSEDNSLLHQQLGPQEVTKRQSRVRGPAWVNRVRDCHEIWTEIEAVKTMGSGITRLSIDGTTWALVQRRQACDSLK